MRVKSLFRSLIARASRAAFLLSFLFVIGCGGTGPSGPHAEAEAGLSDARKLWRSQNLNDYSYVFSRGCFCVPEFREPVTITVRGGAVISVVSVASGVSRDIAGYRTIEGLFDIIREAIDDDAASIQATYDPARGYLTSAYIDLDERLADEEISIEAKGLTPTR